MDENQKATPYGNFEVTTQDPSSGADHHRYGEHRTEETGESRTNQNAFDDDGGLGKDVSSKDPCE